MSLEDIHIEKWMRSQELLKSHNIYAGNGEMGVGDIGMKRL